MGPSKTENPGKSDDKTKPKKAPVSSNDGSRMETSNTAASTVKQQPNESTSSSSPSFLHETLKSIIWIGLGIIAGYGLFYSIFHHRCADLMDEVEQSHNSSMAKLNDQYIKAIEDHKACLEDDSRVQEIYDLRGRLESQSDLLASHRDLLNKHQVTAEKMQEMEAELERKSAELFVVIKRIELHNEEKKELEQDLAELRKSMDAAIGQKAQEIEALKSSLGAFQSTQTEMLQHVQIRHGVMARQFFGKGPYYVKVSLNIPGRREEESFFVVEIASRKDFPHSVFTFLTLVESGMYVGTKIQPSATGELRIVGSDDDSLDRKLRSLGLSSGSALSFFENSSTVTCGPNSFGFDNRGPALIFYPSSLEHDPVTRTCFGQVVRGTDTLSTIQDYRGEEPIQLSDITLLGMEVGLPAMEDISRGSNDEL